jgi:hypothetical protein
LGSRFLLPAFCSLFFLGCTAPFGPVVNHAAEIGLAWDASLLADGYTVRATSGAGDRDWPAETNTVRLDFPPGAWLVTVTAWSTNNSNLVRVESAPSESIYLVIPGDTALTIFADTPFVPPVLALASNPCARLNLWLEHSTNLADGLWSAGTPLLSADLADGPAAFYRVRLTLDRR